jgi:hypothetical protein
MKIIGPYSILEEEDHEIIRDHIDEFIVSGNNKVLVHTVCGWSQKMFYGRVGKAIILKHIMDECR